MSTTTFDLAFEVTANELMEELYELIQKLHRVDFKDQGLIEDCNVLAQRYKDSKIKIPSTANDIITTFENLSQHLNQHSFLLKSKAKIKEVKSNWKELAETYGKGVRQLRKRKYTIQQHRRLKPINYWRNGYHIANALIIYFLYRYVFTHDQALILLTIFSSMAIFCETVRRFHPGFNRFMVDTVFGKVSRPEEHFKINSATYYLVSLTIMTAVAPAPSFLMALLTLGVSDPIANIMGKKFGQHKIYKEKSFVGSFSFFVSSFLACYLAASFHLLVGAPQGFIILLTGFVAFVGTLVELFSTKVDDNMTIIIGCTLASCFFV